MQGMTRMIGRKGRKMNIHGVNVVLWKIRLGIYVHSYTATVLQGLEVYTEFTRTEGSKDIVGFNLKLDILVCTSPPDLR